MSVVLPRVVYSQFAERHIHVRAVIRPALVQGLVDHALLPELSFSVARGDRPLQALAARLTADDQARRVIGLVTRSGISHLPSGSWHQRSRSATLRGGCFPLALHITDRRSSARWRETG